MLILSSMPDWVSWVITGVIILVVVILVIVIVNWFIKAYNNLIKGRNGVKNAWSQIDVQLTRRFDLIPNLVETVKGYASHEKDIWEAFAAARSTFDRARAGNEVEKMSEANNQVSSALARLMVVQEQYPALKADGHFTTMMNDLKDTEEKISFTRQFYNDTVLKYNNSRETFPTVIVAKMFKFQAAEHFKAAEEVKTAPKVSF